MIGEVTRAAADGYTLSAEQGGRANATVGPVAAQENVGVNGHKRNV